MRFMRSSPRRRAAIDREPGDRVFERMGTDVDLADGWQRGIAELAARDRGAQLVAVRRAREHAIASGDLRRQIDAWNEVGGAMLFGRTPLGEVLSFLEDELAWARSTASRRSKPTPCSQAVRPRTHRRPRHGA